MCKDHHVFLIAVNSDASMKAIGVEAKEDQQTRALKVATPLALQHPARAIVVAYYDEETPEEFYRTLKKDIGADLYTLHKWGYGTTPDAPKIIGAEYFERVLAFPLPNDVKPVCFDKTPVQDQPEIGVFKLTEKVGPYGPYLSTNGRTMFPLNDRSLERYDVAGTLFERMSKLAGRSAPTPDQP